MKFPGFFIFENVAETIKGKKMTIKYLKDIDSFEICIEKMDESYIIMSSILYDVLKELKNINNE